MSRKSLLETNPQAGENIIVAVQRGLTVARAVELSSISERTVYNWRQRGQEELDRLEANPRARMRKEERPYVQFLQALRRADVEGEFVNANAIWEAAKGGKQIVEVIERREIDPATKLPVLVEQITKTKTTAPDWRAALAVLERRQPERWAKKHEISGAGGKDLFPQVDNPLFPIAQRATILRDFFQKHGKDDTPKD